jgi:hypothetical protein
MIYNVRCEHEDLSLISKEAEIHFVKSLQMWLRPFSEEINQQNGTLVAVFGMDGTNGFQLENISDDLQRKIAERFPTFIVQ